MPPSPSKRPSPKKKKKAIKADYGGVYFGEQEAETSRGEAPADESEAQDDPMASYRAAAAAAAKAVAKERKEEANVALYRKIFARMDADADGIVEMADVVEKVAAGTAQLSQRAQAARPQGAVALQLPMAFGIDEWIAEMKRMAGQMDESTFEANVLGLFACFTEAEEAAAPAPAPINLKAPPGTSAASPPLDRTPLLQELFNTMDADGDGLIDLDDFLAQARSSVEADELRSLFNFFDATFGSNNNRLSFAAFSEGTLTRTPIGKLKDAAFASAIRGMTCAKRRIPTARAHHPSACPPVADARISRAPHGQSRRAEGPRREGIHAEAHQHAADPLRDHGRQQEGRRRPPAVPRASEDAGGGGGAAGDL